jgi:hypothetical protein
MTTRERFMRYEDWSDGIKEYWNDGLRTNVPLFQHSITPGRRAPSNSVADRVYTSLLPAMSENGLATDKGLKIMIDTLGTALGKNVDFPPERLVDYTLLREVQKELGIQ